MDIDTVRKILDQLPDRTEYEFKNFTMESQGSWHRQVRYALLELESLSDQIESVTIDMQLEEHRIESMPAPKKEAEKAALELERRKAEVNNNPRRRLLKQLKQRFDQVDRWLSAYGQDEMQDMVDTFESSESDSWSEILGRTMGVELLADNHAHAETMAKIALLPLGDYKKAVLITNQFANFLRKTAENVEKTLETNRPQGMSSDRDG